MDASTQMSVERKNFSQQIGHEGEWDTSSSSLGVENVQKENREHGRVKFVPILNLEMSSKRKQNVGTQTGGCSKEKAVQTEWRLETIEIPESRKSSRQNVLLLLARSFCFEKMRREFTTPPLLSPIKENNCENGDMENDDWTQWKVGEFRWSIDNKENNSKGDVNEGRKKREKNCEIQEITPSKRIKGIQCHKKGRQINEKDLQTLVEKNWVNDEVINIYLDMIMERGNLEQIQFEKVFCFNTFFFPRLHLNGEEAVRRWTKKVNIFKYDKVFFPIHLGNHWRMIIADFGTQIITYYDSLMGENLRHLETVRDYITFEVVQKNEDRFKENEWKFRVDKSAPKQKNGYDCGVFVCLYANYISVNKPFDYDQDDIPKLRLKISQELKNQELD
ncbi:sentrin-specific protease 1-like [Venturia canescens]|uniref:sentrin-specific protease 1-like n=1 Tax=Venturia canescens TaxID=32260 RepID=UPI001C9C43AF|nr:sentrin-specific protease 1-like [Venturia canescens]